MSEMKTGFWQMSLAMIISGSIGAFVLLSGLPVTEVVFWRCVIGGVALLAFMRLRGVVWVRFTRATLLLTVAGGIALVVNWLLLFAAFERISMGMSTVVYNTQPFMLVLMSMLLGERVSLVKWGWLLLAFLGVVILLASGGGMGASQQLVQGVALSLGAAFFYALTAIITRRLSGIPPGQIALVQVLTGAVMLLPVAGASPFPAHAAWGWLLALGIVHTGIMYQLLYSAIQKLPTPVIGSLSFVYPLVALLVDALVFGHTLSAVQIAGGVLILFAAAGNNLGWGASRRAPLSQGR